MLASAVPRLMGTKVTSSSASSSSLLSKPDTLSLPPPAAAAAAADALRVLRGVAPDAVGVSRGVAGVSRESAGPSVKVKPVALQARTPRQMQGGGGGCVTQQLISTSWPDAANAVTYGHDNLSTRAPKQRPGPRHNACSAATIMPGCKRLTCV
jgi:hypothetical protein